MENLEEKQMKVMPGGKAAWESEVEGQSATPNAHEMLSLLDVQAHHLCHIRKETWIW